MAGTKRDPHAEPASRAGTVFVSTYLNRPLRSHSECLRERMVRLGAVYAFPRANSARSSQE